MYNAVKKSTGSLHQFFLCVCLSHNCVSLISSLQGKEHLDMQHCRTSSLFPLQWAAQSPVYPATFSHTTSLLLWLSSEMSVSFIINGRHIKRWEKNTHREQKQVWRVACWNRMMMWERYKKRFRVWCCMGEFLIRSLSTLRGAGPVIRGRKVNLPSSLWTPHLYWVNAH